MTSQRLPIHSKCIYYFLGRLPQPAAAAQGNRLHNTAIWSLHVFWWWVQLPQTVGQTSCLALKRLYMEIERWRVAHMMQAVCMFTFRWEIDTCTSWHIILTWEFCQLPKFTLRSWQHIVNSSSNSDIVTSSTYGYKQPSCETNNSKSKGPS